jgi:hypothetical protein
MGVVNGPGSSVVGNVVLWNDTTGTTVSDSGKTLSIGGLSDARTDYANTNIFLGQSSGTAGSQTGTGNTAVGVNALNSYTNSSQHTAVGDHALAAALTSTNSNTAVGSYALTACTGGGGNTAVGSSSGSSVTSGGQNTTIGDSSGNSINTGNYNTILGRAAGSNLSSGSSNVVIGRSAGSTLQTGSSNIVIGASIDVPASSTSNYLNIGGAITGDMTTGPALMNGFTATTQSAGDNSTKVATTAYANAATRVRTTSITSSSTPTPNADTTDNYTITALAAAPTFGAPTGSPVDGQRLVIRIKDNATARALAWNAAYRAGADVALPTTTVISKTMYVGLMYNSADSKWDCVSSVGNI